MKASWLGCFPNPQTPCNLSGGMGGQAVKADTVDVVSYLPAYLPAVPHVGHQRLVWRFGRLRDGDACGVLRTEGRRREKKEKRERRKVSEETTKRRKYTPKKHIS